MTDTGKEINNELTQQKEITDEGNNERTNEHNNELHT